MVHQFINNGYLVILDVNSSSVHSVDPITYAIINSINTLNDQHIEGVDYLLCSDNKETIRAKTIEYISDANTPQEVKDANKDDFDEAYSEITSLVQDGLLYTKEVELNPEIFAKKTSYIKALCLNVAHACNLKCKYCFASQGDYNGKSELMSFEVGKKAIDFLIANSGSRINLEVDFFGGEPLLDFDVVKQIVEYGNSIQDKYNKNFRWTITTNGMLLDDDNIDFINKHMHNVVLSLDGRKEINDNMRPTANDKGSYDVILPKFKKLVDKRNGKQYYIRGTFTHYNTDFANDVVEYVENGFLETSLEPVVCDENLDYALKGDDIDKVLKEYDKLSKKVIEYKNNNKPLNFFHFMIDLSGGPCIYKRMAGCGAGSEYLCITPNGDIYPCHQFAGNKDFCMGNVDTSITNPDIINDFKRVSIYSKPDCKKCFAKYFCSGGCMANAYNSTGDINGIYEKGCIFTRKRIECAIMIYIDQKLKESKE